MDMKQLVQTYLDPQDATDTAIAALRARMSTENVTLDQLLAQQKAARHA